MCRKIIIYFFLSDPDDFLPPPQNFSVSDSGTSGTSITFRWNVSRQL